MTRVSAQTEVLPHVADNSTRQSGGGGMLEEEEVE